MISVIIPTYNEEKNIENCLKSLLNQTLPRDKYEIIVVDGRSEDRTVKIARKYADKVILQKSEGVGGARNDGIKLAKYDLIATTDADCIAPRDWLERIVKNFENKDIVCVYGQQKPLENTFKNKISLKLSNIFIFFAYFFNIYLTVGANMAFRKKSFLSVGGYKSYSAGDDFELPLRLKKKGKIKHDPKMKILFSMRRYDEDGILKTLMNWILNIINEKYNLNLNIKKYNKKCYKYWNLKLEN